MQNGHSQKDRKLVFKTNYCLMQVKSIAECSKGSILQYFRPSLSHHLLLRSLFCLFLSGRFTQVLLYTSLVWKQTASSAALAICSFVVNCDRPQIMLKIHKLSDNKPTRQAKSMSWNTVRENCRTSRIFLMNHFEIYWIYSYGSTKLIKQFIIFK